MMIKMLLAGVALMVAALFGDGLAVEPESGDAPEEALSIRLDLTDGSSLLGSPVADALQVTTRYGWELDVPFRWISSFSRNPDATNVVLHLLEGDQLTVQMRDPAIKLDSLLGLLETNRWYHIVYTYNGRDHAFHTQTRAIRLISI